MSNLLTLLTPALRPRPLGRSVATAAFCALSCLSVMAGAQATPSATTTTAQAPVGGLEALRQRAKTEPRNAAAQTELGQALLRAGQLDEAERVLKKAAAMQRGSIEAAYEVLKVTFARGDHRAARGACARFKPVATGTPYEHLCFARAFLIWHRSSRAIEYLDAALALDADHVESLLAVGDAELIGGNYDAADRAYERARGLSNPVQAQLGLARVALARGDRTRAISVLRSVKERAADWPEVVYELGRLLDGDESLALLQQAVALRPGWDQAALALGEAQLEAGHADRAEAAAAEVIARNPRVAEAHTLLGRARQAQGNLAGAEQALTESLTLVPNLPEATLARADLFAATERYEEAFAEYQKAAGLRPLDSDPLLRAARLSLRLQRFNLAAAFLDRALDRSPRLAAALALYGDVMVARGDRADARGMYERALAGEGELDRAQVQEALRKLKPAS